MPQRAVADVVAVDRENGEPFRGPGRVDDDKSPGRRDERPLGATPVGADQVNDRTIRK
jgi:hypothetical protein